MEHIKSIVAANFNCKIYEAFDGLQGIKVAREVKPDLILMDIVLPYISGYAATVRLRKIEGLNKTVIIGMTADVDEFTKEKVLSWCDDFVPKPINEKKLVSLLRKFLVNSAKVKKLRITLKKANVFKEQITSEIVEQLEQRVEELEEAKQRIEYLNKLKTRLMTLFSHEIKTPLTTITGYSECIKLMAGDCLKEDATEMLDRISSAANRINCLLEEVNWFNKIRFDNVRNEICNPFDAIKSIVNKRKPYIEEKNLNVILNCDEDKEITLKKEYFEDIFDQIFKNAIVYNKKNGEIIVDLKIGYGKCVLKVTDSGCGIKETVINSIFEPLTQEVDVEHYQTHKLRGLGMGLAICKEMVENICGKVSLAPRKDKTGTVVTVEIPEK